MTHFIRKLQNAFKSKKQYKNFINNKKLMLKESIFLQNVTTHVDNIYVETKWFLLKPTL